MSVFPNMINEETVQEKDKTRLDASKSFKTADEAAITAVEIDPDGTTGFLSVFDSNSNNWFLDWEYPTETGSPFTISVRVTTDGAPVTKTSTISVVTAATDNLFTGDQDLIEHEPDILKWVKKGRNSYIDYHRRAKELILDYLDRKGYTDLFGERLTRTALVDDQEFKEWSTMMVLKLIYQGISNASDDFFAGRASFYRTKENDSRNRFLRVDLDGDLVADLDEGIRLKSGNVFRR